MQLLILKVDKPPLLSRGDIIETRATDGGFTDKERGSFVCVGVDGVPMTDFMQYSAKWRLSIAFEVVAHQEATDGYRIRLFADNAGAVSGRVTRDGVEAFIESWGGTVFSFGDNEVVFDVAIYDALTSTAFWEFDLSSVFFSEISYDTQSGIHRISADYSALSQNASYVERYVHGKGLTIVSHSGKVLVFDADRSVVRSLFEEDIKESAKRKTVMQTRHYLPEGVVAAIEAAGGYMQTDASTLLSYIREKS